MITPVQVIEWNLKSEANEKSLISIALSAWRNTWSLNPEPCFSIFPFMRTLGFSLIKVTAAVLSVEKNKRTDT